MAEFVLVRHPNGTVSPVSAAFAARRGLEVVDDDPIGPNGLPKPATRDNGRPIKPHTTVDDEAAKKASGDSSPEELAVTPPEGAAETTLTDTTTKE